MDCIGESNTHVLLWSIKYDKKQVVIYNQTFFVRNKNATTTKKFDKLMIILWQSGVQIFCSNSLGLNKQQKTFVKIIAKWLTIATPYHLRSNEISINTFIIAHLTWHWITNVTIRDDTWQKKIFNGRTFEQWCLSCYKWFLIWLKQPKPLSSTSENDLKKFFLKFLKVLIQWLKQKELFALIHYDKSHPSSVIDDS